MRRSLRYLTLSLFLLSGAITANAQLALGDIAFTGYNSSTADNFAFVVLKTGGIPAGTVIKFTDRGWWGNATDACGANEWATNVETEIVWTSAVAIPYGRQVVIQGLTASYAYGAPGTVTGTALSLAAGGDQIFAYTGTQSGPYVMIAAIHMNYVIGKTTATDWDATGNALSPTATESNRPACIVNGTHGLFITQPAANPDGKDEVDNAVIKYQVVLSGNPATDRSRINNVANWDVRDGTDYTLPNGLSGLPVNFTWIRAAEKTSRISVEWGVGVEEQIQNYTIEKSDDGRLYMEMGVIAATGQKSYSWTDPQPSNGINYYRIRANELSGATKYSTIAVVNRAKGGSGIQVYPTIVKGTLFSLQLNNMTAGNYKLNLHSVTGQLVMSRVLNHGGGSSTQTITLPATIQKGVYKVSLTNSDAKAVTSTIVVQ